MGITLTLLLLNLVVLFFWLVQLKNDETVSYNFNEIAENLVRQNGQVQITEAGRSLIRKQYQWAMLLSSEGTVLWSENLPADFPDHFSAPEIASFSRWYLQDYPVHVWRYSDGLLVFGSPKGSLWKHGIEMPEQFAGKFPTWLGLALILNALVAFVLALLLGLRLFRSLRPLIKGIEGLAQNQPIQLSTSGLLGDLANQLNQTSEQLRRQEAALQKRDTARTTWIAGVSHDIRTPLSMVMGYASQLEEDPRLPEDERKQAAIIRRQSEKIKALVSDLNLASKLEYEMQPLRLNSIYPAGLAREVVTDFLNNGLDEDYTIELKVEAEAQGITLLGDEALLRRALSNLIHNSIQHNPDGCAILVTVEKNTRYCILSVSDNGTGFSQAVLDTLQNPEVASVIQPHGLGLTIVQQIVKAHGGAVEFRNLPQINCQVILRLPLPVISSH